MKEGEERKRACGFRLFPLGALGKDGGIWKNDFSR